MDLPRGMRDLGPADVAGIEHVRAAFFRACEMFGYTRVEPSPIEMLSVLEAKSGPAIREEVYNFEDKGGRAVALRFDLTVGMTRGASAQKSVRLPSRRAAFGGVWRYDEPQKGRYRHFYQWDIEVYGSDSAEADAETIEFTSHMLGSLGLREARIELSHRGIAESYIRGIVDGDAALADMLRAVDRTQKRPEAEIVSEYESKGYAREALLGVMRLAHARGTADEAESALGTGGLEGWGELRLVLDSLGRRGVKNVEVNLGIVRGLDYYSGTVFEAFAGDSGQGALAGGGRYDSLAESLGGEPLRAAGAAGGVERTLHAMEAQGVPVGAAARRAVVAYANAEMAGKAVEIAARLRRSGVAATADLAGRALKRQMSDAAEEGARAVVIVAPREIGRGEVIVRNMDSRTEKTVGIEDLFADPASALS